MRKTLRDRNQKAVTGNGQEQEFIRICRNESSAVFTLKKITHDQVTREMFPSQMSAAEEALFKLNWMKDEIESNEKQVMMAKYTFMLRNLEKQGIIKSSGRNDQLDEMFVPEKGSHHIGKLSRYSKDTGLKCTSDRIEAELVLSYLGYQAGNYLEDGVIFGDVPEKYFKYNCCSSFLEGSRWLVSTMGDSIFAYKKAGTIWVLNIETGKRVDDYTKVTFPKKDFIPDDYVGSTTHNLHKAMWYTFTRMPYQQGFYLSIDHVNGDKWDNRWVNLRGIGSFANNQNRVYTNKRGEKGISKS